MFFDVEVWTVDPLFIGLPDKSPNFRILFFHAISELLNNNFSLLFLLLLDLGQYGSHIELETSNKWYLEDKCSHEIIKHIIGLFLKIHIFIVLKFK